MEGRESRTAGKTVAVEKNESCSRFPKVCRRKETVSTLKTSKIKHWNE